MGPITQRIFQSRRDFLTTAACGLGGVALQALLAEEVRLQAAPGATAGRGVVNPLTPKATHFAPRAKSCIFLFMAGAPSQLDLFDPKPKLNELDGESMPKSLLENARFAFIQKEWAVLMGSKAKFTRHGRCGMEISDYLPHIGSCADDIALIRSMHSETFNHHPGQLMMNTGVPTFGRPSIGSWLNYGLGSESRNLPGYVVLTAGRGASGGASNWSSGFLPSNYQGVPFRNQGDPVLNLGGPEGLPHECQRRSLDALRQLNQARYQQTHDPEILSRIASYELAFRMQSEVPDLIDLSDEDERTLEMYGVNRTESKETKERKGYRPGVFATYARNCLLARRLVERGVRFVNIYHASWDHHSRLEPELTFNAHMADQPVAALIRDLKRRGLLDETLVIWAGEFGRTPLAENSAGSDSNTGRDHHPFAFSIFLAGGGVKGGQVIGKTDEIGWNIVKDPIHINDLHATILHLFGLDHLRLTHRFQGRDFRLTDVGGEVVEKLLS